MRLPLSFLALVALLSSPAESVIRRCFSCRSRGDLGDCRDPFLNVTEGNANRIIAAADKRKRPGVDELPCASGWCSKILEPEQDHGTATERGCMLRPPSDLKERCAYLKYRGRQVRMCFCRGDLCNAATAVNANNGSNSWRVALTVAVALLLKAIV